MGCCAAAAARLKLKLLGSAPPEAGVYDAPGSAALPPAAGITSRRFAAAARAARPPQNSESLSESSAGKTTTDVRTLPICESWYACTSRPTLKTDNGWIQTLILQCARILHSVEDQAVQKQRARCNPPESCRP